MKKQTDWYVCARDGQWQFNHRADGHQTGVSPPIKVPGSVQDKAWTTGLWKWEHIYVDP